MSLTIQIFQGEYPIDPDDRHPPVLSPACANGTLVCTNIIEPPISDSSTSNHKDNPGNCV